MGTVFKIARREFVSYFQTTLAVVFLVVFVGAAGLLTFDVGNFLGRGQADLAPFFGYHPWLFLVFMPAIGMRLWAEERRSGTIELLMTLPVATWQAVLGKFLAAWAFAALALILTFPVWITVNWLGDPDNGVILAGYAGSLLMAGAFLGVASTVSALTKNQISAFVISFTVGFLLLMTSLEPVRQALEGWAPAFVVDLVGSVSFANHFDAITRGVLDLRDVIFFVSFIALMLFINTQVLEASSGPAQASTEDGAGWSSASLSAMASVLAAILFLTVNALATSTLSTARYDLTDQHLYTISDSTRGVLAGLQEPVTLRLYRTQQLVDQAPVLQLQDKKVSELLAQFRDMSAGKLRLETIEVAPFSAEEDEALGFRLQGFPIDQSDERGYFGIVGTNALDGFESISFLDPSRDELLQYDLTRLIYRLSRPDEPRIGLLDGLGMYGSMAEGRKPWAILNLLSSNFAMERVAPTATELPADLDVLVVTHPVKLAPELEQAIDQYVLKGGPALVFLDPVAENSAPGRINPMVPEEPASSLGALQQAWGVDMDVSKVVGDSDMALQTVAYAGQRRVAAKYLPWLRIAGDDFNRDDLITRQLEVMRMSSAGALATVDGATTTVTPLIHTTPNTMLFDADTIVQRGDPNELLALFQPSGQIETLAARVQGPARTAFPDAPAAPGTERVTEGEVNLIVVTDTDLLADSHTVGQSGQVNSSNADFVLNSIEALAGGDALSGVRRSGFSYRPFTRVQAIQARAEATYRATEQQLTQELAQVQSELQKLEVPTDPAAADPLAASREQQKLIADYNQKALGLREQLRNVRAALRSEVEAMEGRLRLANVFLIPAILILVALLAAALRRAALARDRKRLVH